MRDYVDLKRVMNTVIISMLPCLLWAFYNTGAQHFAAFAAMAAGRTEAAADLYVSGWLQWLFAPNVADPGIFDCVVFGLQRMAPILIVSYGVGLGIEMMFAVIRKEEVSEGYLVSGMLIALIVPPSIPLWQLAFGVAFAVVLGKEVFGGTGMNIFNPAMMVRGFLFFSFAAQMSATRSGSRAAARAPRARTTRATCWIWWPTARSSTRTRRPRPWRSPSRLGRRRQRPAGRALQLR